LFAPFQIGATAAVTYIGVPVNAGHATVTVAADNVTGQAHYKITAKATSITVFATANLAADATDSFYYQIAGLNNVWNVRNGMPAAGFQEVELGTINGAVVGNPYTLKILRREAGAQIDRLRLVGATFDNGVANPVVPLRFDLAKGKMTYDLDCEGCHGATANQRGLNNTRSLAFLERETVAQMMPWQKDPQCRDQCAIDVSAYIYYTLYKKPLPM
jgi:hypothetical protein